LASRGDGAKGDRLLHANQDPDGLLSAGDGVLVLAPRGGAQVVGVAALTSCPLVRASVPADCLSAVALELWLVDCGDDRRLKGR